MREQESIRGAPRDPDQKASRYLLNKLAWSRRGQVFSNPVTGEQVVLLTDPETHPDRALVAHLFVSPGGRVAAPHVHPVATERFHVLAGRVGFQVGAAFPSEAVEAPVEGPKRRFQLLEPGKRHAGTAEGVR